VQVHSWNQALNLKRRGIPYIYSFDDTHVVYFGKKSEIYKNNQSAVDGSVLSLMHGEFLLEFFDNREKLRYLRHGANPDIFRFLNKRKTEHKLLCVGMTHMNDRKNFLKSIEIAKKMNLPITIVGPNEKFFSENNVDYDKLTIIGNSNDNQLVDIYNDHTIFIHLSKLETGHPNLTLVESIYCGTPVVGTCDVHIDGMNRVKISDLDNDDVIIDKIQDVINDYSYYQKLCFDTKNSHYYDWDTISNDLVNNIYEEFIDIKKSNK
jgi:glycosyltransferase involved in cell wall biosynthesis